MAPPHEAPSSHVIFHGEKSRQVPGFEDPAGSEDQFRLIPSALKRVFKENMDSVAELVDICKRLESEIRPHCENAAGTKPGNLIKGPRRQNLKRAARRLAMRKMEENENCEVGDCIAKFMKEFDIDESINYLEEFGLVLKQVENEVNCGIVQDGL